MLLNVDVSIILCTYKREKLLRQALGDLIAQRTDGNFVYDILVVDDGPTDETRRLVEELVGYSKVPISYIRGQGKGYTLALNKGVKASRSEWLAFFDDDQRTDSNWLRELYSFAVKSRNDVVGGSVVLAMPESDLSKIGPYCRELLGEYPSDWRRKPSYLPAGGNRIVKRNVFDKIGLFDESFLTGGCDRDFLFRASAAGFKMGWTPKAVVRHLISSNRLKSKYIRWYSLQAGCSLAYIDWKRWGRCKTVLACSARIVQAFLIHIPLLILGYIKHIKTEILDRKARLWRAIAYTRKTLSLLSPRVFPQESFFDQMDFRRRQ